MSGLPEGVIITGWAKRQFLAVRESFRDLRDRIQEERSVRLMAALGILVFILAMMVWVIEERAAAGRGGDSWITSFTQAVIGFGHASSEALGSQLPEFEA